nr:hypothetical protein [Pseudonocardia kunmingensis]
MPAGQSALFATHRFHAVFTDNPEPMLTAEAPTATTPSSSRSSRT